MAKSTKKGAAKKSSGKRTLIAPNKDKRYVKRDREDALQKAMIKANL